MTNKERIVRLIRLFQTQTDEDHPISTFEIIDYFSRLGAVIDRKTIRDDVDTLNACGIEIIILEGRPNRYYFADRKFQLPELKLLVDAVEASKFITARKSDELVKKIISMASADHGSELNRHLYTVGRIKPENENVYYVIDAIFRAINGSGKSRSSIFDMTCIGSGSPGTEGSHLSSPLTPCSTMRINTMSWGTMSSLKRSQHSAWTVWVFRRFWMSQPIQSRKVSTRLIMRSMFSVCMRAVWKPWSCFAKTA